MKIDTEILNTETPTDMKQVNNPLYVILPSLDYVCITLIL